MRETDYHPHMHGRYNDSDELHGRDMDAWRRRTSGMDALRPRGEAYAKNGNLRIESTLDGKEVPPDVSRKC